MTIHKIKKILIANRGEIALRVIRTCKEMGIQTVAVFSEADRTSLHVQHADEAYCIGPPAPRESYLAIDKLIQAARKSKCDAVHPGYGFLSENPEFARRLRQARINFIGPSPSSIAAMGDKLEARRLVKEAGVPVVPGSVAPVRATTKATKQADRIGYPILLKAAGGGGGKGMRIVSGSKEFRGAFESAQREALGAFGDDRIYLEKYLRNPRHIEVQILFDHYGNGLHLGERECSIQRRFQKVIEESPSPVVDPEFREKITEAALSAARTCSYTNAGTVEFLVDEDMNFYFLEMNTRLQVEHPVTEMRTGVDIVEEQIRIASGEHLQFRQTDIAPRGHAIECRIYAEDPSNDFMPSVGRIDCLRTPMGNGVRVDSSIEERTEISYYYDPLISKLVCWGADRRKAIDRMIRSLKEYIIGGVRTTIPFCLFVLNHPSFRKGAYDTGFVAHSISDKRDLNPRSSTEIAQVISTVLLAQEHRTSGSDGNWESTSRSRNGWKAKELEILSN
jgi:acetyl-CoA carboxylase biotin carboxylase subunit